MNQLAYFVIDVVGTMTDSGVYYDNCGNELKRFSTRDGEAIKLARSLGIKIIVITGRSCCATKRRMEELNVDFFAQAVLDKYACLAEYVRKNNIKKEELGYIGDDINDLKAMDLAGFIGCPSDSCREVIAKADYVSTVRGGQGAVRDVIEQHLRMTGQWEKALAHTS